MKKSKSYFILLLTVCVFVLSMLTSCGYIISAATYAHTPRKEAIVAEKAAAYLAENYPDNDFDVSEPAASFIDSCYNIYVQSRSSADTYFKLSYNSATLELTWDGYESSVAGRWNTYARLQEEYDGLIQNVLCSMEGLQKCRTSLCRYSESEPVTSLSFSPKGLDISTLILDGDYDVASFGWEYGYLEITVLEAEENVHIDRAVEVLLEVDRLLTEAGVGWYTIDFSLVSGTYPEEYKEFEVNGIIKEDLVNPAPRERIQVLWERLEAVKQAVREKYQKSGG